LSGDVVRKIAQEAQEASCFFVSLLNERCRSAQEHGAEDDANPSCFFPSRVSLARFDLREPGLEFRLPLRE
jgi:hypothetical protein